MWWRVSFLTIPTSTQRSTMEEYGIPSITVALSLFLWSRCIGRYNLTSKAAKRMNENAASILVERWSLFLNNKCTILENVVSYYKVNRMPKSIALLFRYGSCWFHGRAEYSSEREATLKKDAVKFSESMHIKRSRSYKSTTPHFNKDGTLELISSVASSCMGWSSG